MSGKRTPKLKADYTYTWFICFFLATVLDCMTFIMLKQTALNVNNLENVVFIIVVIVVSGFFVIVGLHSCKIAYFYDDKLVIRSLLRRNSILFWKDVEIICVKKLETFHSNGGGGVVYLEWIILLQNGQKADIKSCYRYNGNKNYIMIPYTEKALKTVCNYCKTNNILRM